LKAQVTAEFLFVFTATIILISVLASALIAQHEKAKETVVDFQRISNVKKAARTVEVWLNDRMITDLDFQEENISFRIEDDRFLVRHKGEIIEIEGVFEYDGTEPV